MIPQDLVYFQSIFYIQNQLLDSQMSLESMYQIQPNDFSLTGFVFKTLPKDKDLGNTVTITFKDGKLYYLMPNKGKPPRQAYPNPK